MIIAMVRSVASGRFSPQVGTNVGGRDESLTSTQLSSPPLTATFLVHYPQDITPSKLQLVSFLWREIIMCNDHLLQARKKSDLKLSLWKLVTILQKLPSAGSTTPNWLWSSNQVQQAFHPTANQNCPARVRVGWTCGKQPYCGFYPALSYASFS